MPGERRRARLDVFALAETGLDAFLRAEIGTELNGSPLTMLSALARLGLDPWVEAGSWARLPNAATIDRVAGLIEHMPLCPQSAIDARGTAARLTRLLPCQLPAPHATAPSFLLAGMALITVIFLLGALAFMTG